MLDYPSMDGKGGTRWIGVLGAIWGITGVSALFVSAIIRLASVTIDAFSYDWLWYHWLGLVGSIVFMAYAEGYRGFQKNFSPRLAARARYLMAHPRILHVLLGPFFCMGYFHISTRRQRVAITLTVGILLLIMLIRLVDQPWRGIIDAGVVIGLTWGLITVIGFSVRAFTSGRFDYSPEVPVREVDEQKVHTV